MTEGLPKYLAKLIPALQYHLPLPAVPDLPEVSEALQYHGIAPLLLHLDSDSRLPGPLVAVMRDLARSEFVFASEDDRLLREVLTSWHAMNLPYLLLKGAALERTVYAGIGLRPRSDIDLLVPEDRFAQAQSSLVQMGYVPQPVNGATTTVAVMLSRRGRFGLNHVIDLHYRLSSQAHPFPLAQDFRYLSARAQQTSDGWQVLHTVDALLLAVFHRAQHYTSHGERLIWLYDICLLLRALDHNQRVEIERLAMDWQMATALNHAMNACRELLGESDVLACDREDESAMFFTLDESQGQASRVAMSLANTTGAVARFRFLLNRLFPPVAFVRQYHGVSTLMLPVFYLGRIIHAVKLSPSIAASFRESKRENSS